MNPYLSFSFASLEEAILGKMFEDANPVSWKLIAKGVSARYQMKKIEWENHQYVLITQKIVLLCEK